MRIIPYHLAVAVAKIRCTPLSSPPALTLLQDFFVLLVLNLTNRWRWASIIPHKFLFIYIHTSIKIFLHLCNLNGNLIVNLINFININFCDFGVLLDFTYPVTRNNIMLVIYKLKIYTTRFSFLVFLVSTGFKIISQNTIRNNPQIHNFFSVMQNFLKGLFLPIKTDL